MPRRDLPRPGAGRLAVRAGVGLALSLSLATSGCGAGSGSAGGSAGASGTSAPTTVASDASAAPAFPVTITRTGGIAGFDDRLVVAADGSVTGRTRAGAVSCSLPADMAAGLAAAVATAPSEGSGPTSGLPDALVVTVSAGGRTAYLGGSAGSDAGSQAVVALLADLTLPPGQRTLCR